mmetsp:Transcript_11741/g.8560  ORF Transcript_11741/g.8560 Transcript_11741/m.8560 type:complete len:93 (+) Transcript_11741:287-565(+)
MSEVFCEKPKEVKVEGENGEFYFIDPWKSNEKSKKVMVKVDSGELQKGYRWINLEKGVEELLKMKEEEDCKGIDCDLYAFFMGLAIGKALQL